MRSRLTVRLELFAASAAKPGALTYTMQRRGDDAEQRDDEQAERQQRGDMVDQQLRLLSSPRRFLYSARIGTKACENAPSANRRRSRLGILNATKNASVAMPAPNTRAITASRTKPRMRETSVMLLTVASALSRFMVWLCKARTVEARQPAGRS